jgi:serine/threonine protein phosphatase PrpC
VGSAHKSRATELRERSALSKQLRLDVAQLTDVGRKRPHNEDNMAYVIPKDSQVMAKKGALFIVADGMGGHAAGEVASEIAVDTVSNVYYQDDSEDIPLSLMNAIKRANALIHQRAAENMMRSGMGTTCVAAVLRGGVAYIANVGDSRAYMVRHSQSKQISQDHSWVEEQVRAGLLTKDQARSHAQRNVITRCLGTQPEVEVDIFTEVLQEGDTFVLCSDGLSGPVAEDDLRSIINQYLPSESVYHLVERANENGGPDNITAIVVRVLELGDDPPGALHLVHAGGIDAGPNHVADEKTAILGRVSGLSAAASSTTTATRVDEGRSPSRPLNVSSEPNFSASALAPGSTPMPQAKAPRSRTKRSRLLLPTLAICLVLIIAIVGSGYYFFVRPSSAQAALDQANRSIGTAQKEVGNNPQQALQDLSDAQTDLHSAKGAALTSDQATQYQQLQNSLSSVTRQAINTYNTQSLITALPCVGTQTPQVSAPAGQGLSFATTAIVQDSAKHAQTFALGTDGNLYHIASNGNSLNATKSNLTGGKVVLLTSDIQHVYTLTVGANNKYSLHVYTVDQNGTLTENGNSVPVDQASGLQPRLLTAWDNDIYLILTTSTQVAQAQIQDYNADKLTDAPGTSTFTISNSFVSAAALANKQLFFLHSDGSVKSLTFIAGKPGVEVPVGLSDTVHSPWLLDARTFSADSTSLSTAAPTPDMSKFITISAPPTTMQQQVQTTLMATGLVNKTSHLYLADNANHRVLDFTISNGPSTNGNQASVGGNVVGTGTATATGTTTATVTGASAQLARQYASPGTLPSINNLALDPTNNHLNVWAGSNDQKTTSQVTIDVSSANACAASS